MPALHLSNLFRRNAARPSLGQRAAGLKASLSQVRARPASMPKPGSEEAMAAFHAACHEHTIRTQFANEYSDLKRTPLEWWTSDSLSTAMETGEITPAECARLYPLATERELRMREIEHELNIGALHALAFADSYPVPSGEDDAGEPEEGVSNDVGLIRLGRLFEEARIKEVAACEACNAAGREADRLAPHRPAALTLRASDHPLHVYQWHTHPLTLEGIELRAGDIEWLRGRMPMKHEVLRPVRDGERAHIDHPGHRFDIVAHPEAQARAEEIITAWDTWRAEKSCIYKEHLTQELEDAADEAGDLTLHFATQIANLPARTAEGLRVKLQALVHYRQDALLAELPSEPDPDQILSHSLWRDMRGSAPPAVAVGKANDLTDAILTGWAAWGAVQGNPDDDVQDEWGGRRRALIRKAMALPATPDSIVAKALACAWMEWVETERPGQPRDAYGLSDQLVYDLHAAIMEQGIAREAAEPSPLDLLAAAGLSIRDLPIFDLSAILDSADTLSAVASAIACQPRQMTKEHFNGAGLFAESIAFALHRAIDAVAKELRGRTPAEASDRAERLGALARLTVDNDDPAETAAFARELLSTVEP